MSRPPVVFVLAQANAAANGGVSSVSQIINGLRHHRPIIVTDRETPRLADWRAAGVETHAVPQAVSRGYTRAPFDVVRSYGRYARELLRIIRTSGAQVVHANDPAAFQLALGAVKLRPGTRIALNLRDTLDPGRKPPRARYRFLFGAANHVFYLSEDMADRWTEIAPNAKRAFSVTYSVVDPDSFPLSPAYAGDGPPVVLLSGIIRPKKGQLEFIRNIAPLLARAGIATWLAGDFEPHRDAYMKACAEAAESLGEMVQFLGYRTDVAELIARSALVAVASRHEGLVRAMIEAMSCGRPVVSFDVCSARELLEQQSGGAGTVVHGGDYAGMAEAIIRYCGDRQLALAAGRKGHETARRLFDPREVVDSYERVYAELQCSRSQATPRINAENG